jgi:hypothetical protein
MSPSERCDEIMRLIDEVLAAEAPAPNVSVEAETPRPAA